jgi:transcriptional regulator with XRE-family HTH domain
MPKTPVSPLADVLATNVRALRRKQHLSQMALAERAGLSRSAVAKLELGVCGPRTATIDALAMALGVSAQSLVAKSKPQAALFAGGRGGR